MTAFKRKQQQKPLGPLIVANPDSDSDSISDNDDHHQIPPYSPPPATLSNIEPPAPLFAAETSRSFNPSDDVSRSSRSSPAPSSTPPRTPGHMQPPVSLTRDPLDKGHLDHHVRRPSNEPLSNKLVCLSPPSPSPPLTPSQSPISPTTTVDPRVIMATADSMTYHKFSVSSARSGEAIREMIFAVVSVRPPCFYFALLS